MWREIVGEFESAELRSGVDAGVLDRIEVELSQPIPRDLRSFLIESNGLEDEYGTEIVWSAERILDDNRSFRGDEQYRSLYMAFDPLLFFGDNGGGTSSPMCESRSATGCSYGTTRRTVAIWCPRDSRATYAAHSPATVRTGTARSDSVEARRTACRLDGALTSEPAIQDVTVQGDPVDRPLVRTAVPHMP